MLSRSPGLDKLACFDLFPVDWLFKLKLDRDLDHDNRRLIRRNDAFRARTRTRG